MDNTSYVIEPNNNLRLVMCPLDIDNLNQLTFNNEESQFNYFDSLPSLEIDKITYQRHDNVIRFPEVADNILQYNYVMYQNTNYGNKWFYGFIERIEYSNSNMSNIYIKTDVFQTYQFDIEYKDSFIEREHVNNDTVGLHTVPENIETGDYLVQGVYKDSMGSADYILVMATTIDPTLDSSGKLVGGANGGGIYGGISTGYKLYTFNPNSDTITKVIKAFDEDGKKDAIVSLFMAPRKMIIPDLTIESDNYQVPNSYKSTTLAFEIPKPTSLLNYTPINNKLKTYPYSYLLVTNNNGTSATYQYEYFSQPNADFIIDFIPTIGGSCILSPNLYKNNVLPNYTESISGAKLPIAGWQNDLFTNWLTQNGVNNTINIGSGVFNTGMGALSGLVSGATGNLSGLLYSGTQIAGGFTQIANTIGSIYEHSLIPPQANGQTNTGDVNYSIGNTSFTAYQMSIKPEFAKIIDNYFSMYGYKVNEVKKPNITGRLNWNFVKSIGLNIVGDIPQYAIEEIKRMFNNGITLWHNPNTFLDYSQNNNII